MSVIMVIITSVVTIIMSAIIMDVVLNAMSVIMGDKFVEARKQAVDCVTSLNKAIQDAGGTIPDTQKLEELSVMDFITTIAAQNNIRFHYNKPDLGQKNES